MSEDIEQIIIDAVTFAENAAMAASDLEKAVGEAEVDQRARVSPILWI